MTSSSVPEAGGVFGRDGPRSILSNFTAIFIGRFVSALAVFLALVVLAKLSDPSTVGIYALAQAICIPISEIARMGLREIRSSDASGAFGVGDYFGLRVLAAFAALVLMVVSGALQSHSMAIFLVIILYGLSRCVWLLSDIIYGQFQAYERMDDIGRSLCMIGPLSLLFLTVGYWTSGSLVIATLGQLVAHAIVLVFHDVPMGRKRARQHGSKTFKPIWDRHAVRKLALQALPLTFATVLIMVALYLPRVMVESELGLSSLGVFAAVLALAMAPVREVQSLGIAASVRLARHFAAGRLDSFVRLLGIMVLSVAFCGALGVLMCAAFGEAILGMVYTDAYAKHSHLFVWLVAAASLRVTANLLQFGVIATRRFWWLSWQNSIMAAVAVASSVALVPRFGLTGAGIAMLLIFSAQLAVVLAAMLNIVRVARRSGGSA